MAGPAGGIHGFPAALTSFVGRPGVAAELAAQLGEHRLVTLTGPGGAGKTRLAGQVALQAAGQFADGVWLAELAAVRDPAQVAGAVAVALGIHELPSVEAADALARALARRQLLLVLDNCEHVIGAAAELCGRLLLAADDVRVLATSREPLRIAGEARYRLGPLALPDPAAPAAGPCEAVQLFTDRARQADLGFALDAETGAMTERLVARLDGMPLAIELAAARVEVLGVAQLLERMDDRFGLLADGDRLADERQRSLAGVVQWSYQLLDESEQRVFRAVSAFPGPFTLDGAEAVAGPGAARAVLRLVDCSLLVPPRADPDGRSRYLMQETLRAYGTRLLAEAGEEDDVCAALAAFAADVAEEAGTGLHTRTWEPAGLRHLDAEDLTLRHALAWALEHDPGTALRLALAQWQWWQIRGRLAAQAPVLAAAAEHVEAGSDEWCVARMCLGQAAAQSGDPAGALALFTAARDTLLKAPRPVTLAQHVVLMICLFGRSSTLLYLDRVPEAAGDARASLAMAEQAGLPGLEATALAGLSMTAWYSGDRDGAIRLAHQAQRIPDEFAGALHRALNQIVTMVLTAGGELAAADEAAQTGLAWCREAGDLGNLVIQLRQSAILDLLTGRIRDAAAHLHEQLEIALRTSHRASLLAGLDCCAYLCAAARRPAEAVTMQAAVAALSGPELVPLRLLNTEHRDELLRKARALLGPARTRAAEERGAVMSLATAAEYALMLAAEPHPPAPGPGPAGNGAAAGGPPVGADATAPGLGRLSPRERELVTLVARGHTDAQIAAQLYISVRTVSSHLDRIRDKTGCRRRADLTRLALSAGLV